MIHVCNINMNLNLDCVNLIGDELDIKTILSIFLQLL